MAPFQGMVQCRVCEARITVAASMNSQGGTESAETKGSITCPICESTVSFDAPSGIDEYSVHVMGFEYDAEARKRRPTNRRLETEGD
jgi:hypothetical protein